MSTHVNTRERDEIHRKRGALPLGEFLRRAALGQESSNVPELNVHAWGEMTWHLGHVEHLILSTSKPGDDSRVREVLERILLELRILRMSLVGANE